MRNEGVRPGAHAVSRHARSLVREAFDKTAEGRSPAGLRLRPCRVGEATVKVRVTAAGLLEEYLPADSDGETTIEMPDTPGAPSAPTLRTVMREAGIPENASPLISLNGVVVPRSQHATRTVSDGDAVHFMPNLKGG